MMLEEKHSFGEALQERIETVAALNKNSSRHAANDLPVNVSMHVRVKPEQPNVSLWNLDLVCERLAGSDVKKHIVAVVQRRNSQAVKMRDTAQSKSEPRAVDYFVGFCGAGELTRTTVPVTSESDAIAISLMATADAEVPISLMSTTNFPRATSLSAL
jgi:hypothetical protein